jgi:hypothetical protein
MAADVAARLRTAREQHNELLNRRQRLDTDLLVLRQKIDETALAGHTGDEKAARLLKSLERQFIEVRASEVSLDSAIRQSTQRVKDLEAQELAEIERANAEAAEALRPPLIKAAEEVDAAISRVLTTYRSFRSVLTEMRRLGARLPQDRLIRDASRRALAAALVGSDLSEGIAESRTGRPGQARGFAALAASYTAKPTPTTSAPTPPATRQTSDFMAAERAKAEATVAATRRNTAALVNSGAL